MPSKTSKTTEPKQRAPRAKKTSKNGDLDAAAAAVAGPAATALPTSPTPEQIRARAYEIFRTGTNRDPVADWFQAEQELRAKTTA
jgi:hypothetical protein